ncbi:MAG TPA: SDR family oxidoreductase [Limnobacter sp.]|uniref:SDR family oxidoreductase n=1 Tax=Limnobacter sp. TaxID=2003368 RepID=UPI002EDB20F4
MFKRKRPSPLFGKVIAITGAARGIGLTTARLLREQGAQVAMGDIDEALVKAEADKIGAMAFKVDVRQARSMSLFVQKAEQALGDLDVMVNNAGIMPMGGFLDEDPKLTDTQIDINLRGVIHGMRAALPSMLKRQQGHIINVASLAGRFAIPGAAVYCATKYGVVGLTESVAGEFRGQGVHFTAVMPSKVSTELASGLDGAVKGIPSVEPQDVAKAISDVIIQPRLLVAVPDYLQWAHAVYTLVPTRLAQAARKLAGDTRILDKLDKGAHAAYDARIHALSKHAR